MKPSILFRAFSWKLSASPASVAPLTIRTEFDQRVTAELDALQSQSFGVSQREFFTSAAWVIDVTAASATTQKIALQSLTNVIARDSDRKLIDEYFDDNVDMLDACNEVSEKTEVIQKYIQSLRRVTRLLEANFDTNPATMARARDFLDSCNALERSREMNNECIISSRLRKMSSQRRLSHGRSLCATTQLGEILTGSKAVALLVCAILCMKLSFKSSSKCLFPSIQLQSTNSWSFSLLELQKKVSENRGSSGSTIMAELHQTIEASLNLRDRLMKPQTDSDQIGVAVEELTSCCGELEERVKGLEGRVKELYKSLIAI